MSATAPTSDPDKTRRLLRERARKLAQVPARDEDKQSVLEVVRFRLGEHRYAIEAQYVFATRWLHELTPVPGTPPAFLGITPHQGGVLAVIALDVLFGKAAGGVRDLHRVLIVGTTQPEVGIAAGKEIEMAWIAADALLRGGADGSGDASSSLVAGTTEDGVMLLDGTALLADERMFTKPPRHQGTPAAAPDGGE